MKKILIVSDTPTHPTTGGNRMCILQNANLLRSMGYEVDFLYVSNGDAPEGDMIPTSKYWGTRFHGYKIRGIQSFLRRVIRRLCPKECHKIDFWYPKGLTSFVNRLHKQHRFDGLIVNYVWLSGLARCDIPVKALYTHDVFANRGERTGVWAWRSFSVAEEAKGVRRFKNILAIQQVEASYFRYLAPWSRVRVVYSPVEYVETSIRGDKNVLFFSGGGELNFNGIKWFINKVWPLVLNECSEATLHIGGGICKLLGEYKNYPSICLHGFYDNPSDFYILGDVAINPVYEGTGLKIKTLEGLAHGKYMVCRSHSVEGIYDINSAPVFWTDDTENFSRIIINGLENRAILNEKKVACHDYIVRYNEYIRKEYSDLFEKDRL